MKPADTVIHARWVITGQPIGTWLAEHAVVIRDARVIDVLPSALARRQYAARKVSELQRHVLLPGLINMHTHAAMTLLRGVADDLELQNWLHDYVWPVESALVDGDFVADGTMLAIAEMLRAGTTCFSDLYFFPDRIAQMADILGMRAVVGLPVMELATRWASSPEEYVRKGLALLDTWQSHDRLDFAWAPHAPYTVSNPTLQTIARISSDRNLLVHMHVLESDFERVHSQHTYGKSVVQRLADLQLLCDRLLAVHLTKLESAEIDVLARHGVHAVHCPQSNLKLASGVCPVDALMAGGVNVTVGTDGAASNNNLDLLSELQTAALLSKGVTGKPTSVSAPEALAMVTLNAAQALGKAADIGSIEVGKYADLAALDFFQPETQPVYNPIAQLVYAASSRQFTDVWVGGRQLLAEGRLTTVDLESALDRAESWHLRIEQTFGSLT